MITVTLRWIKYPINTRNRRVICRYIVVLYCIRNFTDYLFIVFGSHDYVMYDTLGFLYLC